MKRAPRRPRGATLAELMVSMALGLAVLLAAGALLVAANGAYVAQVNAAAVDDAGRYAIGILEHALRQGAYVDWEHGLDPKEAPARLEGLDGASIGKNSAALADPAPGVNGSDVLAVRFAGAGPKPWGDGSVIDCAGFPVAGQEEGWSIFYVARSSQGEPELRCKYRGTGGWSADAVAGGVDGFQVLYGLDTDAMPDGVANRYVNASALAALDSALVLKGAGEAEREQDRLRRTWWKRIVSVKLALLLHGERESGKPADATYELFGPAYDDADDRGTRLRETELTGTESGRRQRRLFGATVVLRGRER
jgi:type IV pilus assembly protein PilW